MYFLALPVVINFAWGGGGGGVYTFNYTNVNNVMIPYLLLLIVGGILPATTKTK